MSEETRQKLIDQGRSDLVETYDLIQSGYAGVDKNGTIVDRRKHKDATPIQENSMLSAPKPKKV